MRSSTRTVVSEADEAEASEVREVTSVTSSHSTYSPSSRATTLALRRLAILTAHVTHGAADAKQRNYNEKYE